MRGKILKVKTGFNPNSSSIGTNLTPLILGGLAAVVAIPIVSFMVARRLRRRRASAGARGQGEAVEATLGHSGSGSSIEPDMK